MMRLILLAVFALLGLAPPAPADVKSQLTREAVEAVARQFGAKLGREGAELLARKLQTLGARYGDDAVRAAFRSVGPQGVAMIEKAGVHGGTAARVLARHGPQGAVWVAGRPQALGLVARHGDEAAAALVKHPAIAEPLVRAYGPSAAGALTQVSAQNARRLAMLEQGGELARWGRADEFLAVIRRYGDEAADFVWKNKVTLAAGTAAAAFLANPEPFLQGACHLADTAGAHAVRPLAEAAAKPLAEVPTVLAGEIARRTDWTLLGILTLALVAVGAGWWAWRRRHWRPHAAARDGAGVQGPAGPRQTPP